MSLCTRFGASAIAFDYVKLAALEISDELQLVQGQTHHAADSNNPDSMELGYGSDADDSWEPDLIGVEHALPLTEGGFTEDPTLDEPGGDWDSDFLLEGEDFLLLDEVEECAVTRAARQGSLRWWEEHAEHPIVTFQLGGPKATVLQVALYLTEIVLAHNVRSGVLVSGTSHRLCSAA